MRVLLDTHAFYWWLEDVSRLSDATAEMLASPDTDVMVSVVSILEIANKARIKKLATAAINVGRLPDVIEQEGFLALQVSLDHALLAGSLQDDLRDPFDRMLAAQALTEDVALVSKDRAIGRFGCEVIW